MGTQIPHFYGRAKELAWLSDLFEEVAENRVPRLAVILAESGVGKSRLVQALYQKLTVDPKWDPPETNYWPDEFQDPGTQLRVNPVFEGHEPKEPPKFMWLGLRWIDPEQRNVEERTCPLPEAREALTNHVNSVRKLLPFLEKWREKGMDLIKEGGVPQVVDAAAEMIGIPGINLLREGVASVNRAVIDRNKTHHEAAERTKVDAGEAFQEELGKIMHGKCPLPTILWLDDAQWIDPITLNFLASLLSTAERKNWPLLVIATHWEREWKQSLKDGGSVATSLAYFASHEFGEGKATEVRTLHAGEREAFRDLILERLPGLTAVQQELLMKKAAGNFLTMMENIGELERDALNFIGEDEGKPLTPSAFKRIQSWESDRERRVRQRFRELTKEIRTILGWSGRIGNRFIAEVVTAFAANKEVENPDAYLSECVDPYAILGIPKPLIREFRDRAFHRVASDFFEDHLREDETGLMEVLDEHLTAWTNASFDTNGNLLPSPADPDLEPEEEVAPESSILALQPSERLDLLTMAVEELPLP